MIRYSLSCDRQHRFEGWFPSSVAFEKQAEAGQIACPECASRAVTRAPMAPQILSARARGQEMERRESDVSAATSQPHVGNSAVDSHGSSAEPTPTQQRMEGLPAASATVGSDAAAQLLEAVGRAEGSLDVARALRRYVEGTASPVGDRFADLALGMHRGEIADANIYGSTTQEEREKLADEGVPIQSIPWVPLEDA